jgi:hypothetical protein
MPTTRRHTNIGHVDPAENPPQSGNARQTMASRLTALQARHNELAQAREVERL